MAGLGELQLLRELAARSPCRRSSRRSARLLRIGSSWRFLALRALQGGCRVERGLAILKKKPFRLGSWPKRFRGSRTSRVEYLEARAGEPCGKTCLTIFLSGFCIVEKLGQVPVELRFSSKDLVKWAVAELTRNLRSTGVIQAPFLDSGLCLGERAVVDRRRPTMVRVTAWMRLLKCWASMRFDDLMWLDPDSVLMSEAGLEATMSRSKTSNKLKKADAMKIFVSASSLRRGKELG